MKILNNLQHRKLTEIIRSLNKEREDRQTQLRKKLYNWNNLIIIIKKKKILQLIY